MKTIFEKLQTSKATTHLLKKEGRFVLHDCLSCSLLIGSAFSKKPQKICVVAPNLYSAQQIYEQLINLVGEENTLFYPQDEVVRFESEAYSKEMIAQRLYVMEKAMEDKPRILIVHAASLTRYLPEVDNFKENIINLKVGNNIDIQNIISKLTNQGFSRVSKIDGSLQFALRGDILDIYPINLEHPVRIDIFDDEIESIRNFDLADQLSREEIKEVNIFPGSDLIKQESFSDKTRSILMEELKKCKDYLPYDIYQKLEENIYSDIEKICEVGFNENFYKYYSLFIDKKVNILDYFNPEITFAYTWNKIVESYDFLVNQIYAYFSELFKHGKALKKYDFFDDLVDAIQHSKNIVYSYSNNFNEEDIEFKIREIPEVASNVIKSIENVEKYVSDNKKVIICLLDSQYDTYKNYLDDFSIKYEEIKPNEIPSNHIGLTKFKLLEGFELLDENIIYLSPREIFGYKNHVSKFLTRYKSSKVLKSYDELEKGDFVVHEECGIGQFEEICTMLIQGVHKDFLKIKYANAGVLYVPLEQFRLVRKYVSKEGAVPKLNKIGGTEWEKTKQKIKNRVNDLADRLIQLNAIRNSTPGFAFKEDDEFQYAFEKAFPYVLTNDQLKAVEEIKKDMEASYPMDRLLCGDVGFGKTEVAFRAAFKAILSGTQVALLCPTTLLARQHYEKALERFSLFGVKIAIFSRFVPESVQKRQIEEIGQGNIHLIIGTHRLLSKDIYIPNLKLLIIDEEQRFGVEHKEKIKELTKNIDCLTLTATPIPRTLQMSLLGMRSLSQLQSAPLNRMPIQTYVTPYDEILIKEVIEREMARNGQIFYLHNVTSTIGTKVKKLQSLVKDARIDFVHGKMDKDAIEDVMSRFYNGEIDVLVCTSIIETGLDIANANSIIVENADKFGLSQLYQIKGRVGRSNRIAYAYLLYDDQKELSEIAQKRLKALKDFTELGSGFKIAQRDLSIRGAGDILGPEQAGFIDTVGIDMYIKLLNEVIDEKKGIKKKEENIKVSNLTLDSYIPNNYVDEGNKLEVYQDIQNISSIAQLELYSKKLKDIYGKLPQQVKLLLRKRKIDILGSHPYIHEMKEEMGSIVITLTQEASMINKIGIVLFEKLGPVTKNIKASFINRQIKMRLLKNVNFLEDLEKVLIVISELSLKS